jgi:hypothetical protein
MIALLFFGVLYRCPPDVIAANAELVQRDGVPVLNRHLDRLEVCVHGHVHTSDCAVNLKQLTRNTLTALFRFRIH